MRRIIARSEWKARSPKRPFTVQGTVDEVWLHHTAGSAGDVGAPTNHLVYETQRQHQEDQGWNDIAYNFLVDRNGVVYEGRGGHVMGGATKGRNATSQSICWLGNYESVRPTNEQIEATRWLLEHGADKRWWSRPLLSGGHRDVVATACPGRYAYLAIDEINEPGSAPVQDPWEGVVSDPILLAGSVKEAITRQYALVGRVPDEAGRDYWMKKILTADDPLVPYRNMQGLLFLGGKK